MNADQHRIANVATEFWRKDYPEHSTHKFIGIVILENEPASICACSCGVKVRVDEEQLEVGP